MLSPLNKASQFYFPMLNGTLFIPSKVFISLLSFQFVLFTVHVVKNCTGNFYIISPKPFVTKHISF